MKIANAYAKDPEGTPDAGLSERLERLIRYLALIFH